MGQANPTARFVARSGPTVVLLTAEGAVIAVSEAEAQHRSGSKLSKNPPAVRRHLLGMKLLGANPVPEIVGLEALPGRVNYFKGRDPAKWITNLPTYASVRYGNVYPGTDMLYYSRNRELEYDFVLRPGSDPSRIRLAFQGADRLEVDAGGGLVVTVRGHQIRHRKPIIYQEIAGKRVNVEGRFKLAASNVCAFEVESYRREYALVIDPVVVYSSLLGGTGYDFWLPGIQVDASGRLYGAANASSPNFPVTAGAFQTAWKGDWDVVLFRINPAGTALEYSTYIGGSGLDSMGRGMRIDAAGNVYFNGLSRSWDFPTTPGAYRAMNPGNGIFAAKLNSSGNSLLYSTFVGASGYYGGATAIDAQGNAYVAGGTYNGNLQTTPTALQPTYRGGWANGFIVKLNPTGTGVLYATFLGGSFGDMLSHIEVDSDGNMYVAGGAESGDMPVTPGALLTTKPRPVAPNTADAYIAKIDSSGTELIYGTYFGYLFSGMWGMTIDGAGCVYVAGPAYTASGVQTTPGVVQTSYGGGESDAYVSKLNPTGTALVFSTFLGGAGMDAANHVALDSAGNVYVTGGGNSANYPVTPDALQTTLSGGADGFLTVLNPSATALLYSSYIGGANGDGGPQSIAFGPDGAVYLGGETNAGFPVVNPIQESYGGGSKDLFVMKLLLGSFDSTPPVVVPTVSGTLGANGWYTSDVTVSWTVADAESPILASAGCGDTIVGVDTAGTTFTCSASSAGGTASQSVTVKRDSTAPAGEPLIIDPSVAPVGTAVMLIETFTDSLSGIASTGYTIDGGDPLDFDSPQPVTQTTVGVKDICVSAIDNAGNLSAPECGLGVWYDPEGGFVTGGGWIWSPLGAYALDPTLEGKATFGFNSKYRPGATEPSGNTEFQFRAAGMNFSSTQYYWLVAAGARAQFKGTGTINGEGEYGFIVTAIDGALNGGGGDDKFRIKIWDKDGVVVYDNQRGTLDGEDPTTVLGGGSIIVHKP